MILAVNLAQVAHVKVSVNLRCAYVTMAKKHLYGPEIRTAFKQVSGKGVTQYVGIYGLFDACLLCIRPDYLP